LVLDPLAWEHRAPVNGLKSLLFVLFLVLVPVVPLMYIMTKPLRDSRKAGAGVARGRSSATPFSLITVIGTLVTVVVFLALVITLVGQRFGGSDNERTVDPRDDENRDVSVPRIEQGDLRAGKLVFQKSGCGGCHTLAEARTSGTTGPDLDERNPDFAEVVGAVSTGPGIMPAFSARLSNAEIRNVALYISTKAAGPEDEEGED
jgi:mono/diheme cytochrome c family protein